jgi:hypothetical protein
MTLNLVFHLPNSDHSLPDRAKDAIHNYENQYAKQRGVGSNRR